MTTGLRRSRPHRAICVAGMTFCIAALAQTTVAQTVDPVGRSLRDLPTTLTVFPNAPQTVLQPAGVAATLRAGGTASSLGKAAAPDTVLRAAEVPTARVEHTRQLLQTLDARLTRDAAIVVDLPADVLFDFDKSDLRADAKAPLDRAADLLRSYPQAPVEIQGHTDSKGSDAYNDGLSLRRARTVAQRLCELTDGRTLTVRGFGEREPVAPNAHPDGSDDAPGRQRNRRVAIVIQPRP